MYLHYYWLRLKHLMRWFVYHYGRLFLLLAACNIPTMVQIGMFQEEAVPFAGRMALTLAGIVRTLGMVFLLTLALGWLPKVVQRLAVLASFLLALVDGFALYSYHNYLDEGMMQVIFETNPQEAREYVLAQSGHLVVLLAAVAVACCLLRWGRGWFRKVWHRAQPRLAVVLAVGVFLFAGTAAYAGSEAMQDGMDAAVYLGKNYPQQYSLGRVAYIIPKAFEEIGSAEYVDATLAAQPVELTRQENDIPQVVFILGESTSRHHMQLYGYELPTTPQLAARAAKGELTVFTDVISPHAATMAVMKTLFCFYDLSQEQAGGVWYEQLNLFDILRRAGIRTAWVSNQESAGFYGSIGRTLAGRCDEHRFTSSTSHTIDLVERYDEEVLPLLDDSLTRSAGQNFTVVHLMGAHEDFNRRYPASFAHFTADDESGEGRAVRAEYDNAVLYDDYIVDQIIRRFEAQDAIVIFISDHGEEINDTRAVVGHGDESSSWQRDIPMVCWTSEKFCAKRPALVERLAMASTRPYMTDDMIHTLLDLLQTEVPAYRRDKSILQAGYLGQKRLLKGKKPYRYRGEDREREERL
ncbi:Phosphoethanolamine transferase for glucans (OPG), alkaline phosphatase superfamily [Selenomonas sp. GACV-9]|uniref:phosphoethanolamine transferase n=1 Tax=Selenomonas sp. GACV-9 TaxID=3158782 RepID=UPI0008EC924E|nr:Phosphoethanolamine transferase for glucans (OPG), alkaline phosphatase superfamily [Selenomonas ruminantium]